MSGDTKLKIVDKTNDLTPGVFMNSDLYGDWKKLSPSFEDKKRDADDRQVSESLERLASV
jgi:hypothetical protein